MFNMGRGGGKVTRNRLYAKKKRRRKETQEKKKSPEVKVQVWAGGVSQ